MKLLLDTHLLIWAAWSDPCIPDDLSARAAALIDDPANDLLFSVASLWEVAIKNTQGRADFQVDPGVLCRNLVSHGYTPLPIKAEHAVAIGGLPNHHKDPFDRMLVAQAIVEGVTLVTADPIVARYPGAIRQV